MTDKLDGPASPAFSEQEEAENRIAWIEQQIRDLRHGLIDKLRCPYCRALNKVDQTLCCVKMTVAIGAVLDRLDSEEKMEHAMRIADRVS